MKHFLRLVLFLCLPLLLAACEEGVLGPKQSSCVEIRQTSDTGASIERVYDDDNKIIELRNLVNGDVRSLYTFTYENNGLISESQYYDVVNNIQENPEKIQYNSNGKWVKTTLTNASGSTFIYEAEYDDQNQIEKFTASTENAGVLTVRYTITYNWVGGNNILYTYNSPTSRQIIRYEFDLTQENKRRREQEKVAYLYTSIAFNKNMYKRIVSTTTNLTTGTTTETTTDYNFQFNEEGYPTELTRTITTGTASPTLAMTYFDYSCD